jgi:hypothetical protein
VARRVYQRTWSALQANLARILAALQAASVEPIIFKGCRAFADSFGGRAFTLTKDVDILVHPDDLAKVKLELFRAGLRQGDFDRERGAIVDFPVRAIAAAESDGYELASFVSEERLDWSREELEFVRTMPVGDWGVGMQGPLRLVEDRLSLCTFIDIHYGVFDGYQDLPNLFARATRMSGLNSLAMNPADELWILAARYYVEVAIHGKRTLRELAYLCGLLRKHSIDWDLLVEGCHQHGLGCPVYYILAFLDRVTGDKIPQQTLSMLKRSLGRGRFDFGWQLGKLFEFYEPFPFSI